MKAILANPKYAATTGFLLALPFLSLFLLLIFGFEPGSGPLARVFNPENGRLGSLFVFGAVLLLGMGGVVSILPVVRGMQAENSITVYPLNVFLTSLFFLILAAFLVEIVIDQYPCWIGVPNCD